MPIDEKKFYKIPNSVVSGSSLKYSTTGRKVPKAVKLKIIKKRNKRIYATYQYLYEQDSRDLDAAIYTLRHLKDI